MKLFFSLSITASTVFAVSFSVPSQSASPFADTEAVTNLPVRIDEPGRDWHFDFQMSCAVVSNSVQMAFGVDEDANGSLSP